MPNQAESAQKTPRRSRRNHKPPGASSSSQAAFDAPKDSVEPTSSSTQTTQASQQSDQAIKMAQKEHTHTRNKTPSTPQRAHSTEPSSAKTNQMHNEAGNGSNKKKDANKSQSTRQKAQPKPSQSSTPSPFIRPETLNPVHMNETPSKAYAGPTFHASPAASSLPMPKFFSKSVPNVDKTTSLKNMLEPDAPETGSTDEDSPSLGHAKIEGDRQVREESPLDIFFQADRQAKAKANFNPATQINGVPRGLSPFESLRPDPSPSRATPRHHSRQPTDSSTGGVFNLELGSPPPPTATPLASKSTQPANNRSISASFAEKTEEQIKEEQRQERNIALKRMLLVPGSHRPEGTASNLAPDTTHLGSPSPKGRQSRGSPTHNPSRPSSASPALGSDSTQMQRQAALRALAEQQIPTSTTYLSQNSRTPAIRKETASPSPSRENNLEAQRTPKPARLGDSPPSAHTRSQTKNRQLGLDNNNIPIQGLQNLTVNSNQQRNMGSNDPSPTTIAIENDLRRILKMEIIGSDGAPVVKS